MASQKSGLGAEARILAVLAARHPARLTEAQWATLAGMKRSGGTWQTYKSRLRTRDMIQFVDGKIGCTKEGLAAAGVHLEASAERAYATWRKAVGGAGRMLDAVANSPAGLTRAELAARLDMAASGGTFQTYLSRLRSNELIVQDGQRFRLAEILR